MTSSFYPDCVSVRRAYEAGSEYDRHKVLFAYNVREDISSDKAKLGLFSSLPKEAVQVFAPGLLLLLDTKKRRLVLVTGTGINGAELSNKHSTDRAVLQGLSLIRRKILDPSKV